MPTRLFAGLLAALVAAGPAAAGAAGSSRMEGPARRVVSLNLCTDEMVLRLLPPERVAGVTWLSRDPSRSTVADLAAAVPVLYGNAEEVLGVDPDLIVAGLYTARSTVEVLRRLGHPVHDVGIPTTEAEVEAQIRELAALLGVPDSGERLVAEIDARFAALPTPAPGARPRALVLDPNGFTVGRGSIVDAMITRAGLDNAGASLAVAGHGAVPLEVAILTGADILIIDADRDRPPALATALLQHPALRRLGRRITVAEVPSRLWTCAGPGLAEAAEILATAALAHRAATEPGEGGP